MAGKRDPTLSRPLTPPCLKSMPLQIGFYITQAVRYEQLIFHPPLASFSSLPPLVLSFLLLCFALPFRVRFTSPFLLALSSWYSEHVLSLLFSVPVWSALSSSPCVIELSRMCRGTHCCDKKDNNLTPSLPFPLLVALHLNPSSGFCIVCPVSVYRRGQTGRIYSITR